MPLNASDFGGASAPKRWVTGTNYAADVVVLSPVDFCYYVRKIAGAGATDPSSDTTNWQNTNGIKGVQRGVITISSGSTATATITSVNTAKTDFRYLGCASSGITDGSNIAHAKLTNSTTVTATRTGTGGSVDVSWELTERF